MTDDQLAAVPGNLLYGHDTGRLIAWLRARGWQLTLHDLDAERRRRGITRRDKMTTDHPDPDHEHARELARELLADLAEHIGNPDALRAVLLDWTSEDAFGLATMHAVDIVFTDCLSIAPAIPPGSTSFAVVEP